MLSFSTTPSPPYQGGELTAMLIFCIGSPPRPTGSSGRAILGGVRGGKSAYSLGLKHLPNTCASNLALPSHLFLTANNARPNE